MAYLITGIRLGIDFYHTIFAAHFATAFLHGGRYFLRNQLMFAFISEPEKKSPVQKRYTLQTAYKYIEIQTDYFKPCLKRSGFPVGRWIALWDKSHFQAWCVCNRTPFPRYSLEVMFNKRVGVFYHNIKHDA